MIRTIDNCTFIKRMVRRGECLDYAGDTDEPCEICKECSLNSSYEL